MSVTDYLQRNRERSLEELNEWLRIPSISAKSEHREDTARAAEWLAERMRAVGMKTVDVVATAGNPVVVGEWRGAPEGAPTLLVYGHYDVQPPEPLDEWKSPPFEPVVTDGRIYGRGSVDDKGQVYLHLKAVEAHLAENGSLPVNVVFLVEGEEEVGSPNLGAFLKEHVERLRCDAVMISDTTMFAPGLPSITVGLRGLAYMEVRVQGPSVDLHSGAYGGAVVNPALVLARILSQLHDEQGRITIPGFYDRVRELTAEQRAAIAALPVSRGGPARGGRRAGAGRRGGVRVGGAHLGAAHAGRQRPPLRLHRRGRQDGAPARAMAKVSMRLVPDQDYRRSSASSSTTSGRWRRKGSRWRWRRCTAGSPGSRSRRERCSTRPSAPWPAPTARTR
jgi:acetylornithine deacetylase/succinyl-diaminopimelate desuccinylase-like protein